MGQRIRCGPLLAAITEYEADNGSPPPDVRALIPRYLDAAPSTDIGAFPRYYYRTGEFVRDRTGDEWMIEIPVETILGTDRFSLLPEW